MRQFLTSIELCAGAGGQALGLERAGFRHLLLVDNDPQACATLRKNRPSWTVLNASISRPFSLLPYRSRVDLLAAGIPCPPFSVAGLQLGRRDERNLFPDVLRLVAEARPRAVLIENVRGILDNRFSRYRGSIRRRLAKLGYESEWRLLNASDFGVPQLRPRAVLVALRKSSWRHFSWPHGDGEAPTVGEVLRAEMGRLGWRHANAWASEANRIAPTLVGGSKKHGGPDLGPTRARHEWRALGVDGLVLAEEPPAPDFSGLPRLTVRMAALIQGFPTEWEFEGKKTAAYRQVGNAFPPQVAEAVARAVRAAIERSLLNRQPRKATRLGREPVKLFA